MPKARVINVQAFIDEHPISRHQMLITGLIFVVVAFDGMDIGIMGYVAPEVIRTWGISKPEMGTVLSAVFFGMAGGAFFAGPAGDRWGRKIVIVNAVFWFGITTLFAAFATGLSGLLILRILAGIGLGAAVPAGLALMAEYAPLQSRSLLLTIVFSGFTAGASCAGLVAALLLPAFGWQVTLATAGVLPGPKMLKRIDPQALFLCETTFCLPVASGQPKDSFAVLLTNRYALTTAMLCIAYFMGVLVTYIIVGWLPVITRSRVWPFGGRDHHGAVYPRRTCRFNLSWRCHGSDKPPQDPGGDVSYLSRLSSFCWHGAKKLWRTLSFHVGAGILFSRHDDRPSGTITTVVPHVDARDGRQLYAFRRTPGSYRKRGARRVHAGKGLGICANLSRSGVSDGGWRAGNCDPG